MALSYQRSQLCRMQDGVGRQRGCWLGSRMALSLVVVVVGAPMMMMMVVLIRVQRLQETMVMVMVVVVAAAVLLDSLIFEVVVVKALGPVGVMRWGLSAEPVVEMSARGRRCAMAPTTVVVMAVAAVVTR